MLNLQFYDYSAKNRTQNIPEGYLWFKKYINLFSDTR